MAPKTKHKMLSKSSASRTFKVNEAEIELLNELSEVEQNTETLQQAVQNFLLNVEIESDFKVSQELDKIISTLYYETIGFEG